jgi:hypothetical protein
MAIAGMAKKSFLAHSRLTDGLSNTTVISVLNLLQSRLECSDQLEQLAREVAASPDCDLAQLVVANGTPEPIMEAAARKLFAKLPRTSAGIVQAAKLLKSLRDRSEAPQWKSILSAIAADWIPALDPLAMNSFSNPELGAQTAVSIAVSCHAFGISADNSMLTLKNIIVQLVNSHAPLLSPRALVALLNQIRDGLKQRTSAPSDVAVGTDANASERARHLLSVALDAVTTAVTNAINGDSSPADVDGLIHALAKLSEDPRGLPSTIKRETLMRMIVQYYTAVAATNMDELDATRVLHLLQLTDAYSSAALIMPLLHKLLPPLLDNDNAHAATTTTTKTRKNKVGKAKKGGKGTAKTKAIPQRQTIEQIVVIAAKLGSAPAVRALQERQGTVGTQSVSKSKQQGLFASAIDTLRLMPTSTRTPAPDVEAVAQEAMEEAGRLDVRVNSSNPNTIADLIATLVRVGYRRVNIVGALADRLANRLEYVEPAKLALMMEAIAQADPWKGASPFLKDVHVFIVKRRDTLTCDEAVLLAAALGHIAKAQPELVTKTSACVKPLIPIVLRRLTAMPPPQCVKFVTALAQTETQHTSAFQTVFARVEENRSSMTMDDITLLLEMVKATKFNPEARQAAVRVGRSVVAVVVGGASRAGSLDLSVQLLEPLVHALATLAPTDQVCLEVFDACYKRRREISPACAVRALRLANRMPVTPTNWKPFAEHLLQEAAKSSTFSIDLAIETWLLTTNGGVRDVNAGSAIEKRVVVESQDVTTASVRMLFDVAYRLRRTDSLALAAVLQHAPNYAERLTSRDVHTILGSMFALQVKNRNAIGLFAARACNLAGAFNLEELRTIAVVLTKTRTLDRDSARVLAEAVTKQLKDKEQVWDVLTALTFFWFYARHELALDNEFRPTVEKLARFLASKRTTVSSKVPLAIQMWEAIEALRAAEAAQKAVAQEAAPSVDIGGADVTSASQMLAARQPKSLVPDDLYEYFKRLSATLPMRKPVPAAEAPAAPVAESPPMTHTFRSNPRGERGWGQATANAGRGWS